MKAVKSGYSFNVFNETEVSHISLEKTNGKVMVNGEIYPLYRGKTFLNPKRWIICLMKKGKCLLGIIV